MAVRETFLQRGTHNIPITLDDPHLTWADDYASLTADLDVGADTLSDATPSRPNSIAPGGRGSTSSRGLLVMTAGGCRCATYDRPHSADSRAFPDQLYRPEPDVDKVDKTR